MAYFDSFHSRSYSAGAIGRPRSESAQVRLSDTFRSTLLLGGAGGNAQSNTARPGSSQIRDIQQSYLASYHQDALARQKLNKTQSTALFRTPSTNLAAAPTRTSYQDSNIFGTKGNTDSTVQASA